MAAVAHNKGFAKKVRVPQSVGKDFTEADKSKKMKKYSGADGESDVKAKKPKETEEDRKIREANENEANVPDWVLEDALRARKEFAAEQAKKRAEKAKEKAARKKEQDDWGKEQVDRQKRREEVLAGKPRDKDKVAAKTVEDQASWRYQPREKAVQEVIPDAPAPLSEGNIEKELKFNPGSKDEMTADEARKNADKARKNTGMKKGGKVKKFQVGGPSSGSRLLRTDYSANPFSGLYQGSRGMIDRLGSLNKIDLGNNSNIKIGGSLREPRITYTKKFNDGGSVKSRIDGCAQRGKTRGKYR